ncbi:uncharacterized protein DUF397 [Herbihabitans rhizosphaerae]|uniref:Uncharacterized protein DUF397 n=1 Tax=Herbihabitans rhizosphaerae TaxID=1872711 RepID=A0A4V2ER89_9PSEU|nr:DUF397 domain-containing protein [Herbihabitans rhizosphaerae]RZS29611.1 uncharacterized protein DUF397 [Herbihabitans rhizosphaerae]
MTVDHSTPTWRRSSFSSATEGTNCVELAHAGRVVAVRDSKNTAGPVITLSAASLARLIDTIAG